MVDLLNKASILNELHENLSNSVEAIAGEELTLQKKAQRVNALVTAERNNLSSGISSLRVEQRGTAALLLQYCVTVVGLEYRHRVWPYEYMAFSRRIGELWEAFCCTAWTYPVNPNVKRIYAPDFADVRNALLERIVRNIGLHAKSTEIMSDASILFEIIGDINMKEDEVFTKDDIPYVIDFKSGFGSNEKGNMLRLLTVGRAYKIWDHRTQLMLLVRQDQNNNYLNVLRRSRLWAVYTGSEAYKKIHEITGADIESVRNNVIDWRSDLSREFYSYLKD
jgi:hypothetical protein